jgi:hypothetical protein
MKLRHTLMIALMIVTVAGIAHAVASDPSRTNAEGPARLAGMPDGVAVTPAAPAETAADPYLNAGAFSSEAPEPMVGCQIYAYQCTSQGGPCGPVPNTCHCALFDDGWVCAR